MPEDGADVLYFFSNTSDVAGGAVSVQDAYTPPPPPPPSTDPDAITINENELGAIVGTLVATDEDANDTHTYVISGADADLFEIIEGQLKLKEDISINYESTPVLNIDITVTDSQGLSFTQSLEVHINDVNEQPSDITLSQSYVEENITGAVVATLTTIDEDQNDAYTYSLCLLYTSDAADE